MYLSGFGHSPYYRIFNEMRILCFPLDVGLLLWILILSCEIRYKFNVMRGWQSLLCYGVLYLCPSHPQRTGTHIVTAKSAIKPQQIIFRSETLVCHSVRACLLKFYILSCMVNETVPPRKTTAWDISANAPKTTYVWQKPSSSRCKYKSVDVVIEQLRPQREHVRVETSDCFLFPTNSPTVCRVRAELNPNHKRCHIVNLIWKSQTSDGILPIVVSHQKTLLAYMKF